MGTQSREGPPRSAWDVVQGIGKVHEFQRPVQIDVEAIIQRRASKLALIDALSCLPEQSRRCLQLTYGYRSLRTMSLSEISRLEGISVDRIKTILKRAIELLAQIVSNGEEGLAGELLVDDRRSVNADENPSLMEGQEYSDYLAPSRPDASFSYRDLVKKAPACAGCYAWVDGISGEVLRIGKAKNLWFRLVEYPKDPARAILLMFQWLEENNRIFEALEIKVWKQKNPDLLEVSLLQEFRPRFNVMHGSLPMERSSTR
jgi:hypothetical protein